jgi:uncharacterized protein YneF (UPF0154 family)
MYRFAALAVLVIVVMFTLGVALGAFLAHAKHNEEGP